MTLVLVFELLQLSFSILLAMQLASYFFMNLTHVMQQKQVYLLCRKIHSTTERFNSLVLISFHISLQYTQMLNH